MRTSGRQQTDAALKQLQRVHAWVDRQAAALSAEHASRLRCERGCADCCVDDLTVFDIEAENIRRHCSPIIRQQSPHPPGSCCFLDSEGACRIYAHRPYVCRTQGLPLRWLDIPDADTDAPLQDKRDICELNEPGPPLHELPAQLCWNIGPVERKLAELQGEFQGAPSGVAIADASQLKRVPLRMLFESLDAE